MSSSADIMKIYTKTGDTGQTSLFGGQRITKAHQRIESYGTVDELNAQIGLVLATVQKATVAEEMAELVLQCESIQQALFVIGSHLSTPYDPVNIPDALPPVEESAITDLEKWIDDMDADLPPLQNFILPSGTITGSQLHVARTVARRAERAVIRLAAEEAVLPEIIQYFNRLSDYLFVAARYVNHAAGVVETPWKK